MAAVKTKAPTKKTVNITGVVCGVRVEDVSDPLMQRIRYLDKLIDELANGKKMTSVPSQDPSSLGFTADNCISPGHVRELGPNVLPHW